MERYLQNTPHKTETTGLLVSLFEQSLNGVFNLEDLELIEVKFLRENNLPKGSNHRFLYRLKLLKFLSGRIDPRINYAQTKYCDL